MATVTITDLTLAPTSCDDGCHHREPLVGGLIKSPFLALAIGLIAAVKDWRRKVAPPLSAPGRRPPSSWRFSEGL